MFNKYRNKNSFCTINLLELKKYIFICVCREKRKYRKFDGPDSL